VKPDVLFHNLRKDKIRNQYTKKIFYIKPPRDNRKFTAKWYGHVHEPKK
jgi:hypothetical protein